MNDAFKCRCSANGMLNILRKNRLTACPECGRVQYVPNVMCGESARCGRCGAVLARNTRDTVEPVLALTLAGLILFVIANTWPFLSLELKGLVRETTLTTGIIGLYAQGMTWLALLVSMTCLVFPLVQLLGLIYLLLPIWLTGTPAPYTAPVYRCLGHLRPWSMTEVFMLAILVAMIKLAKMAAIVPGPSIWAFAALILVLTTAFSLLNPEDVWQHLPIKRGDADISETRHFTVCHSCHLTCQIPPGKAPFFCPRCGGRIHGIKPYSLQRTWALVIAAIVFYIPANLYPVTVSGMLGQRQADTIISGVILFLLSGSWHIALIIFVASVVIPLIKLMILIYLLFSVQFKSRWRPHDRTRLYRFTEAVGRWSMVDVYVVTVLVALVKLAPLASVDAGPGAIYFAGVVVITMFAAQSFDPRLIWGYEEFNDG